MRQRISTITQETRQPRDSEQTGSIAADAVTREEREGAARHLRDLGSIE